MKNKLTISLMLVVVLLLQTILPIVSLATTETDQIVAGYETITFNDDNLYTAIKETVGDSASYDDIARTMVISSNDLSNITELKLISKGIKDVSGLEYFTGLTVLDLTANDLTEDSNLDKLASLTNLQKLNLSSNSIKDISMVPSVPTLDVTSQKIKLVETVDMIDTAEEEESEKGVEITLPQIFKAATDNGATIKVMKIENGREVEDTDSDYAITNTDEGIVITVSQKDGNKNVLERGIYKLKLYIVDSNANKTEADLVYIAINTEDEEAIYLKDNNLYKAVKKDLINGTTVEDENYSDIFTVVTIENLGKITESTDENVFAFDEEQIFIISKANIFKNITRLVLEQAQIVDLDGLENFVGLQELSLNDNYIENIDTIKDLYDLKAIKEKELQEKVKAIISEIAALKAEKDTIESEYNALVAERKNADPTRIGELNRQISSKYTELKEKEKKIVSKILKVEKYKDIEELIGFPIEIEELEILSEELAKANTLREIKAIIEKIQVVKERLLADMTYLTKDEQTIFIDAGFLSDDELSTIKSRVVITKLKEEIAEKELASVRTILNTLASNGTIAALTEEETKQISATTKDGETVEPSVETVRGVLNAKLDELARSDVINTTKLANLVAVTDAYSSVDDEYLYNSCETEIIGQIKANVQETIENTISGIDVESLESKTGEELSRGVAAAKTTLSTLNTKLYNVLIGCRDKVKDIEESMERGEITSALNTSSYKAFRIPATIVDDFASRLVALTDEDIERLVKLPELKILDLGNNKIRDISPLREIVTLEELNLSQNLIADTSVVDFSAYEKMTTLNLASNRIENITIENMPKLVQLSLADNLISDTSNIKVTTLPELTYLNVSSNRISDIQELLDNLSTLIRNKGIKVGTENVKNIKEAIEKSVFTLNLNGQAIKIETQIMRTGDEVRVKIPAIFAQAEALQPNDVDFGIISVLGSVANDGQTAVLSTRNLGNNVATITIEGGIASGTTCIINYNVVDKDVKVESITITGEYIEVDGQEQIRLTATVTPENATNKMVVWTSSDETVATVSSIGIVTAVGEGTTVIRATATDGSGVYGEIGIQVGNSTPTDPTDPSDEEIPVESINLNKTEVELAVGDTETIEATVVPENATNKTIRWSSNDETVATVDENGTITAVGVGEAIITVAVDGETSGVTAKIDVTVIDNTSPVNPGEEDPTQDDPTPAEPLTSSVYNIITDSDNNKYIVKVLENTTVEEFTENIQTSLTLTMYDKDNNEVSEEETLKTGMKLTDNNENSYTIVVMGDLNGDGIVNIQDLSILKMNILENNLEGAYLMASDLDNSEDTDIVDLSRLKLHIVGLLSL